MGERVSSEQLDVVEQAAGTQAARISFVAADIIEQSTGTQAARVSSIQQDVIIKPSTQKSRLSFIAINVIVPTHPPIDRVSSIQLNVLAQNINLALPLDTIITPEDAGVRPPTPSIVGIDSHDTSTEVYVVPDLFTGSNPNVSVRLYRAPFITGPYTAIVTQDIDQLARENILIDILPPYGREAFYVATMIDSEGFESNQSLPVRYSHVQVD